MYFTTAAMFDLLTPNAPYPACHANAPISSDIHPDEFALMFLMASEIAIVAG
jgi:hypothetical protein